MWTREEDGDWTIVKEDFRTVQELGRFLHDLQVKNDHAITIREHGHKAGMKPLQELLDESGVLRCDCDIPKRRPKKFARGWAVGLDSALDVSPPPQRPAA